MRFRANAYGLRVLQPSLRDLCPGADCPGVETPGYSHRVPSGQSFAESLERTTPSHHLHLVHLIRGRTLAFRVTGGKPPHGARPGVCEPGRLWRAGLEDQDHSQYQMKLNFGAERILAVVAHPDDAELLCAGTLARAKADGAVVAICVLCRGDKGQAAKQVSNLCCVRRKEMAQAAKLMGARVFWGGFADGTLADERPGRLKLIEFYRQFRPTLVLAHSMEDYHPDHRAASRLAEAATWFCASRGHKTPSAALKAAPALWWMDTIGMDGFIPGFFVEITKQVELKQRMMRCHQSQLSRGNDSDFSDLSKLMRLRDETRGMQSGVPAAEAFQIHRAFKRARAW